MASENAENPMLSDDRDNIQMEVKDSEAQDNASDDPKASFLGDQKDEDKKNDIFSSPKIEFAGMTKEELMQFDKDPFWKKVRLVLFILFWIIWIGMLVAVVVIIVVSPKCPYRPKQSFWQKDGSYKIELNRFRGVGEKATIGNFKGVESKLNYLSSLGFKNIIMCDLLKKNKPSKTVVNHKDLDTRYGSMKDLKSLIKAARKKEMKIIMEVQLAQTATNHPWYTDKNKMEAYYVNTPAATVTSSYRSRPGDEAFFLSPDGKMKVYGNPLPKLPNLNFGNADVKKELLDALRFWLDLGISGFVVQNAAFLSAKRENYPAIKPSNLKNKATKGTLMQWYAGDRTTQLFQAESYTFVQEIRELLKEVESATDKPRVLIVDPGNLGFQPPLNKVFAYYGTEEKPGAHVVLNEQFAESTYNTANLIDNLNATILALNDAPLGVSTAYQTAGCYLPRSKLMPRVAAALLLPGAPLLYYGQELGMSTFVNDYTNSKSQLGLAAKASGYNSDNVDAYANEPMQWSSNPNNFGVLDGETKILNWNSNPARINDAKMNNYRSLSAFGNPKSSLNVITDVMKLRSKAEALRFGKLTFAENLDNEHLIFSRTAEGFKSYQVIANFGAKNYVRDLSFGKAGTKGTIKFIYNGGASRPKYAVDSSATLDRVYIPAGPYFMIIEY